jgi:hypothetical protein
MDSNGTCVKGKVYAAACPRAIPVRVLFAQSAAAIEQPPQFQAGQSPLFNPAARLAIRRFLP